MNMNEKKAAQLGMPFGTANGKLRKMILFHLLKKHHENICYRCNKEIETVDTLSIEHKIPWLYGNVNLFWNMENIAFSHLVCNISDRRQTTVKHFNHGTITCYNYGCRCDLCRQAGTIDRRKYKKIWKKSYRRVAQAG